MNDDRHPIPQNVTGFQFKLIGDMTVKQFAYLAGNVIVAYIFYLLPLPAFLKWPIIAFFVLFGLFLAFVPFQGRPIDRWIINFFKAVFSNNQYVFKMPTRVSSQAVPPQIAKQLPTLQPLPAPKPEVAKQAPVLTGPVETPPAPSPRLISVRLAEGISKSEPAPQSPPTPPQIPQTPLIKIREAGEELEKTPPTPPIPPPTLPEQQGLQEELQKLVIRKGELEKELTRLKKTKPPPSLTSPSRVRSVSREIASSVGIPSISQFPNLISGIIKDTKGDVLPNILVEVKNKEGNLVRAFKTNKLGQFAAATTLENGTYTIELEDPQNQFNFEKISLTLDGNVVLPLEIKNLDNREELRRRLFNQ